MKKRELIPNTTLSLEDGHQRIKFVILSFDFKNLIITGRDCRKSCISFCFFAMTCYSGE